MVRGLQPMFQSIFFWELLWRYSSWGFSSVGGFPFEVRLAGGGKFLQTGFGLNSFWVSLFPPHQALNINQEPLNAPFWVGCCPGDFQEGKRPIKALGEGPIKVGKRPIKEGNRPVSTNGPCSGTSTAPVERPIWFKRSMDSMNQVFWAVAVGVDYSVCVSTMFSLMWGLPPCWNNGKQGSLFCFWMGGGGPPHSVSRAIWLLHSFQHRSSRV